VTRDLISIMEFSPIVETFEEQPFTIRWVDSDEHPYTPDFLIKVSRPAIPSEGKPQTLASS
jgi:hypothetical protein